jgi:hypothetical protein
MDGLMSTKIVDDRRLGLLIGYAATDWEQPIEYIDYENIATDWQVSVLVREQEPIGAIFKRNGETHVSILPKWRRRWLTKGLTKEILSDMRYTKVADGHDFMYGILERLGFVRQPNGTVAREN